MKTPNDIVYTAMGAVTPWAADLDAFLKDLSASASELLDDQTKTARSRHLKCQDGSCHIPDLLFAGTAGGKYFDRCTKLLYAATHQFMNTAVDTLASKDTGVSVGSILSTLSDHLTLLMDFEKGGLRAVAPMLFPNTVYNCPASQLSILYNLQGPVITNANGLCAGIDAQIAAMQTLQAGRATAILVAGVEESSEHAKRGFGFIEARSSSTAGMPYPVEGAGAVLLETRAGAQHRGATIYGRIQGYSQSCYRGPVEDVQAFGEQIRRTIQMALADAKIHIDQVAQISLSLNGWTHLDNAELNAVADLLNGTRTPKKLVPLKRLLGETGGAGGLLQLICALADADPLGYRQQYELYPSWFIDMAGAKIVSTVENGYTMLNSVNWEGHISILVVKDETNEC